MSILTATLNSLHPGVVSEHRFHDKRRWRFDYAWIDLKVAFEVEGGVYKGGRHTSIKGFTSDCEKYSTAAILGWMVIRATTAMVRDGTAYELLEQAIWQRKNDRAEYAIPKTTGER